jgi:polyphosphate kinase
VLAEARDPRTPLLRRLQLLATAGRHVDELFQQHPDALRSARGVIPASARRERVRALANRAYVLFEEELLPVLAAHGPVRLGSWRELSSSDRETISRLFASEVSPLLTPLTVDATHPFPAVASLSLNLGVLVRERGGRTDRFVGIEVPPALPRFVGRRGLLVCIEDVIGNNLDLLLPGLEVRCHRAFRVTREGRSVRAGRAGTRTRAAVRLEVESRTPGALKRLLVEELGLGEGDVDVVPGPLDLASLASLPPVRCLGDRERGPVRVEPGGRFARADRGSI